MLPPRRPPLKMPPAMPRMKAAAEGFAAGVRAKRPPMLPQMGNVQKRPPVMPGAPRFAPTKNNMNDGMPTNSRSRPAMMSNGGKAGKKKC